MGSLSNLGYLDLSNNKVGQIPSSLARLSNLATLSILGQNVLLETKTVEPKKEFSISNPLSFLGTSIIPNYISNNGTYDSNNNTISWKSSDNTDGEESFDFSQEVNLGRASGFFSGTVIQPITTKKLEPLQITFDSESVNNYVYTDKTLRVPIVLKGSGDYYAVDTSITYDSSILEFKGFSIKNGYKDYYSSSENNSLRYIIASQGKNNPINSTVSEIVYLNFSPKQKGMTNIQIKTGRVANLDEEMVVKNLGTFTVIVEDAPKDINRDGQFTLIDLAIDGYYYNIFAEQTDTTKYDADIVANGKIDDADLQEIVRLILDNSNYDPNGLTENRKISN